MAFCGLELVTGVMGSGKSYYGAEICYYALKEGAQVHTNLAIEMDIVAKMGWTDQLVILPKDVKQMKSCIRAGDEKHPNVLILDEAQMHFYVDDQRDKKAEDREVLEFLTWSRRYGLEIYFLAQSAKNINVKLRRMSSQLTRCVNLDHVAYFGWLLSMFGRFKRTAYSTNDEGEEIKLFSRAVAYDPKIGGFYRTHDLMDSGIQLNKYVTRKKPSRSDQTYGKILVGGLALGIITLLCCGAGAAFKFLNISQSVLHPGSVGKVSKAVGPPREHVLMVRHQSVMVSDRGIYRVGERGVTGLRVQGPLVVVEFGKKQMVLSR